MNGYNFEAPGDVYLIHLEAPLGHPRTNDERAAWNLPPRKPGTKHTAQHYLGWASDLDARIKQHKAGKAGAGIMRAAKAHGIAWKVVRVWKGGNRLLETRLKAYKKSRMLCPVCRGEVEFSRIRKPVITQVVTT